MKRFSPLLSLRWLAAFALVGSAHAAAVTVLVQWHGAAASDSSNAPMAVEIELAALGTAEPVSQAAKESAPSPVPVPEPESEPETPAQTTRAPTEPESQEQVPYPIPPALAKMPEPESPPEPTVSRPEPFPSVPLPPLQPVQQEKVERKQTLKKLGKEKKTPQKSAASRAQKPETRSANASLPLPGSKAAAPVSGTAGTASANPDIWRSKVMVRLNSYKNFPEGARGGTSLITFVIDRNGNVLSSRLIKSSGDAALDREATTLPRRASPLPALPAGVGGSTQSLTVPIRFGSRV